MRALLWTLTLLTLAAWTGLAALGHALLGLTASQVPDAEALLAQWPWVERLDPWLPGWRSLLALGLAGTQLALAVLGDWRGLLQGLLWTAWGLGSLLVLAVAAALHAVVRESAEALRAAPDRIRPPRRPPA
ncbi:hypothetical protein [Ideonella livida]|uniref:Uncharacterized protein n=1 Tax=Ideonella livida TaxID=2707176 RepID=A0A7C9TGT9_9BURK|nr:hypothetical protein [Ideonella livida]NDY90001.1 hypothetical protein [Ideonella livida]